MFPAGTQFNRNALVVIGDIDVTALRVTFDVKETSKGEPNTGTIKIFNAAPESAAAWRQTLKPGVRLDAGYNDEAAVIFKGNARSVDQYREGNSTVVEIHAGDGEDDMRTAFSSKSVAPDTRGDELLRLLAKDLGVQPGNLETACKLLRAKNVASLFSHGGVLFGATTGQMTRVCDSYGLQWSVQRGALQIVEKGKPKSENSVFELSADTGLIGSPKVERAQFNAKAGKHTGETDFDCLLNPLLVPNAVVVLKSKYVNGAFKISEVRHVGDTHTGGDWKSSCKARSY